MAVRDRRLAKLALLLLFAALATLHTWPMPSDPAHLTRLDNDDTAFNTWVIAWVAHQVTRAPLDLFNAPIFYPAPDALAFSEHMIVQGVISLPLQWLTTPVAAYNVMVWLGFALSGWSMALLLRAWTGSTTAGIVSGCLYAFNAHLLTRYSHLQALHMQFFPLVLYAFDRVLRAGSTVLVQRQALAPAAFLLGSAFVLQALCSNYTMVMMTVALGAALMVRGDAWRGDRRMWAALVLTGAVAATVLIPFLIPYARVRSDQGLVRTMDDVRVYSAGWRDYLATAGRLHYTWWSHQFFHGTALFPGVLAVLLASIGVARGEGLRDARARMAAGFGIVGFALSFGAALPGYDFLQTYVPLMQGIRAAARWGLLFLIAIAILAGYGAAVLQRRWGARSWWPVLALALVGGVTVEALRAPLSMERFDDIPAVHNRLATDEVNAIVVFPLYWGRDFNLNAAYMLHQTRHWKPMLNAYSSFAPRSFHEIAERLQSFPDGSAIAELKRHGFSHVVLHRAPLERDYGRAAVDALRTHGDLQYVVEQEGVVIYRVR